MMTRQTSFLELIRQFPPGGGVMTFAMEPAPCISVVSRISFKLLFSSCICSLKGLVFSLHISHLISTSPSTHLWASYCSICHMFTLVSTGLALGGAWGVREGARRPLAVSNTRLRINSVLNSVTRRGTFIGNSAGVMGMFASLPIHIHFSH